MIYWILFATIAVVCVIGLFAKNSSSKKNEVSTYGVFDQINDTDEVLEFSVEDFDKYFDRSAGRYCEHCDAHGSHHTDRHNDYGQLLLSKSN